MTETMTEKQISAYAKRQEKKIRNNVEKTFEICKDISTKKCGTITAAPWVNFDELDMFYSFWVFFHIASCYAVEHGIITKENLDEKAQNVKDVVLDAFGLDTAQESAVYNMMNTIKHQV